MNAGAGPKQAVAGEVGPRLRVTEIYRSLSGESTRAGLPCTLVRLTGCGLRCRWCDTSYAFDGGTEMTVGTVLARVSALGADLVLITGGEPLEQNGVETLLAGLVRAGSTVMVETGGHVDITPALVASSVILDLKAPGSGMEKRNCWANLDRLRPSDEVKFVLASRADYEWARDVLARRTSRGRPLVDVCTVLFSPVWGEQNPAELAAWMLEDRLPVRLNLQLHKILWPDAQNGV